MRLPTDDEIKVALCCGEKCATGPNTGKCHRWDFTGEAIRITELIRRINRGKEEEANEVRVAG